MGDSKSRRPPLKRRRVDLTVDAADMERTHTDTGPRPAALEMPQRIGRFRICRPLGSGGMSVVYEAYDDRLDRKVALKLLRKKGGRRRKTRLQREAQALARLSHENVVEVFEAGTYEGRAFIAMEQVPGESLDRWLLGGPRSVEEVVGAFLQAGRGLSAAHAVGLVHRDFKPSNVLVGEDGRVRVFDFGLARPSGETLDGMTDSMISGPVSLPPELESSAPHEDPWEGALTRTGAMLGTPAYMSPEQYEGKPATAASDQFAYCVALFESLYEEHPFVERRQWDLLPKHVMEGRLRDPPKGKGVPGSLHRVLVRGLSVRPGSRWPSMDALMTAIERALAHPRRRGWAIASVGVLVSSMAAVWVLAPGSSEEGPCSGARDKLDGVWDDERRASVHEAMVATELPYADDAWRRVEAQLDDYAGRWVEGHRDACAANEALEQAEQVLDARMACLDRRRRELASLVDVLAAADREVVERAVTAVGQLDAIEPCAEPRRLGPSQPDDPALAERLAEQREALARALALERAGKYQEGLSIVEAVVEQAEALGHAALHAEALLRAGVLHRYLGAADEAEARLERAYFMGKEVEHDEVARESSTMLAYVVGSMQQRPDDGLRWAKHARVEAEHEGSEKAWGRYLNIHATVLWAGRQHDAALDELHQALVIYEQQWGDAHPEVAGVLNNIGLLLLEQERPAEALGYIQRSLAIRKAALGSDHPEVGKMLNNQGLALAAVGRDDDALESFVQAHELRLRVLGPEHPDVAKPLANLAQVLIRQGKHDEAVRSLHQALAIRERALGAEAVYTASTHQLIGEARLAQGRPHEALPSLRRAVSALEHTLGAEHVSLVDPLASLARAEHAVGQLDEAISHAERALELGATGELPPPRLAHARFAMARARWDRGEHEAARQQAELAARAYAGLDEHQRRMRAGSIEALDAWLAEHPSSATAK